MKTYVSRVVEFNDQPCILFPEELCKEIGINVGDSADVQINERKGRIEVRFLDGKEK